MQRLQYSALRYLGQGQETFTNLLNIIPLQCVDQKITVCFSQHSGTSGQTETPLVILLQTP